MYPISFTFLFNILQHEVFQEREPQKTSQTPDRTLKNTSFQSDMTLDHLLFAKQTPQIVPVALICRTGAGIPMDFRRHQSWMTLKDVELNTKTTFNLSPWMVQARYLDKRKLVENIDFEATKCQNWRRDMLVLTLPRVPSRVSGFPVASPCLWGQLQNIFFSKASKHVALDVQAGQQRPGDKEG